VAVVVLAARDHVVGPELPKLALSDK
jgi:hypothetical protein